MNLWTQITGGKDSRTTKRRPRKARPGLETMEPRAMLSAVATFKLIDGDLYEKQGRHQSLVAANVVSMETLNRRTIMFAEQNGDVFKKSAKGPIELIQRANPNATPNPNPKPTPNSKPTPNPSPNPTPPPSPPPAPAGFSPAQIKVAYGADVEFNVNGQHYAGNGAPSDDRDRRSRL